MLQINQKFLSIPLAACVFLTNVGGVDFTQSDISSAKSEASSLGSSLVGNYRGKTNVNNTAYATMTTDTEVTTLDGTQSKTVNITCQGESNPFAKISYTGTSDITIRVDLDLNQDGIYEKSPFFSGVSGITSDGFAKCSANTFSNCTHYQYVYDNTNQTLSASVVPPANATGLYCINSSCDSLAVYHKDRILSDIAGAVGAVLQQVSSDLVITGQNVTSSYIELYGQDYSTCSNFAGAYTASSGIPSSAELQNQAAVAQTSGNDSWYVVMQADNNEQVLNPTSNSDLNDISVIASTATSTATPSASDGRVVEYTSTYKDSDGNWVSVNDSSTMLIDLNSQEPKSCMVEWYEINTQVATDGKVIGHSGTGDGLDKTLKTEIRECINDYTTCPLKTGETIKYDCGLLDSSIGEALGAFSVLEEMAKDLTCSTKF